MPYSNDYLVLCPKGFITPRTYLEASPELIEKVCNGCGPGGAKLDLVPDSIAGLDAREICNRHDWMYHEGVDRALADAVFIANMTLLCRRAVHTLLDMPLAAARLEDSWLYYKAVAAFGGACFGS